MAKCQDRFKSDILTRSDTHCEYNEELPAVFINYVA